MQQHLASFRLFLKKVARISCVPICLPRARVKCAVCCSGLEARERAAEERAKMVAHKQQARTVSTLRADNIVLVERMNEELAAKRRASGVCLFRVSSHERSVFWVNVR